MIETLTNVWYYTALTLGLFTGIVWTYRTLCVLLRNFGFGTKCTTARYGKDSWAIVTGATEGVGKAAAIHLAKEGFNIVLISRTLAKLETVAKEVEQAAATADKKIKTRVVQLDFTKTFDAATFKKVYDEKLQDLDISVLVNNEGMGNPKMESFLDTSASDVHN